ncbi:hypothetical protein PCE1_002229 [Barthelona sp. PCE]
MLEDEGKQFIHTILGDETVFDLDLMVYLKDGRKLCTLIGRLLEKPMEASDSSMPFVQRENISKFLAGCTEYGVKQQDLFSVDDLFEEKSRQQVMITLNALRRLYNAVQLDKSPLGRSVEFYETEYDTEDIDMVSSIIPANINSIMAVDEESVDEAVGNMVSDAVLDQEGNKIPMSVNALLFVNKLKKKTVALKNEKLKRLESEAKLQVMHQKLDLPPPITAATAKELEVAQKKITDLNNECELFKSEIERQRECHLMELEEMRYKMAVLVKKAIERRTKEADNRVIEADRRVAELERDVKMERNELSIQKDEMLDKFRSLELEVKEQLVEVENAAKDAQSETVRVAEDLLQQTEGNIKLRSELSLQASQMNEAMNVLAKKSGVINSLRDILDVSSTDELIEKVSTLQSEKNASEVTTANLVEELAQYHKQIERMERKIVSLKTVRVRSPKPVKEVPVSPTIDMRPVIMRLERENDFLKLENEELKEKLENWEDDLKLAAENVSMALADQIHKLESDKGDLEQLLKKKDQLLHQKEKECLGLQRKLALRVHRSQRLNNQ